MISCRKKNLVAEKRVDLNFYLNCFLRTIIDKRFWDP